MFNLAAMWSNGWWSPVEVWAEVPVPAGEAFDVVANPRTYPAWLVGAQQVTCSGDALPRPGEDPEHQPTATPGACRRLDLEEHAGPLHGEVELEVRPGSAGTSRVCLREMAVGPLAPLMPLLRPVMYARGGVSLRRLTSYLEDHTV